MNPTLLGSLLVAWGTVGLFCVGGHFETGNWWFGVTQFILALIFIAIGGSILL